MSVMASSHPPAGFVPILGVVVGVVSANDDPKKLGRVKVTFPGEISPVESAWASMATPMAGKGWGQYFLPDIGARVLVVFENGNPECPFVIGQLWTHLVPPPEVPESPRQDNHQRLIQTRSGHRLVFDDTPDAQCIELIDATGKNLLKIESAPGALTLQCDGPMTLKAGGGIQLSAEGQEIGIACKDFRLKADGTVSVEATQGIGLKSDQEIGLSAGVSQITVGSQQLGLKSVRVVVNDGALEVL